MGVRISRAIVDRLLAEAAASPDREVCGIVYGGVAVIEAIEPTANVAADPATAFEIDPRALLAAHRRARMGGEGVIGHYHSHPTGMAQPSARDAACAYDAGTLWLIVAGGMVAAWRGRAGGPVEGAFEPVRLLISR